MDVNLEFPMYLKYSTAVLSPAIVKGTEMEKLLSIMKELGIKQGVAKSGGKDSNLPVTEIENYDFEGIFSELKDDMELNAILFPKKDLKLQVELPNKFDKEGAIGTQIINNLLANFLKKEGVENSAELDDTKKNYIIGDKLYTAKEM